MQSAILSSPLSPFIDLTLGSYGNAVTTNQIIFLTLVGATCLYANYTEKYTYEDV